MIKNALKILILILSTLLLFSCSAQKAVKQECPKITNNAWILQEVEKCGIRNADTFYMKHFVKWNLAHVPKVGDVIKIEGKIGVIIDKPTFETGKVQPEFGITGDPTKNPGYWVKYWKFRFVALNACSTSVYRTNANTQPTHYTRLSKF